MLEKLKKMMMTINRGEDEYEHVEVNGVMDSGAYDAICPMELFGATEIKETGMSKSGQHYRKRGGSKVKNGGCTTLGGESEDNVKVKFVSQLRQGMKQLLISARRAVEDEHAHICCQLEGIKRFGEARQD